MLNLLPKALGVFSSVLFIVCLGLYINLVSKERDVDKLNHAVAALKVDNEVLQSRSDNYQKICTAQSSAREGQLTAIDGLREVEVATVERIEKLIKTEDNHAQTKVSSDAALPDDLVRLLNDHCAKVRGKACTSP